MVVVNGYWSLNCILNKLCHRVCFCVFPHFIVYLKCTVTFAAISNFPFSCNKMYICRWQIRPTCHPGWSWTRHHGFRPVRTIRTNLPSGQLRLRTEWSRKQLGQRSLHRGRWTRRLRPWRCQKGVWELWLSPGIPADPLPGWGYRVRYGYLDD